MNKRTKKIDASNKRIIMIAVYEVSTFIEWLIADKATGRKFNRHTMREGGSGQLEGPAAEYAFDRWCEDNWLIRQYVGNDKTFIDFVVGETDRKYGIDVKAKKRSGRANVQRGCSCHVELRLEQENCHMYVFASCTGNIVEMLGWMAKKEFWQRCKRVTKGQVTDGLTEVADAGKIEAKELRPMSDLANQLMGELWKANTRCLQNRA